MYTVPKQSSSQENCFRVDEVFNIGQKDCEPKVKLGGQFRIQFTLVRC